MSTDRTCDAIPTPGHAIVRRQAPGQTSGGLVIPDTHRDKSARFFCVASSVGYYDHGVLIKSELKPGDEVVLTPNAVETIRMKDGTEHRRGQLRHISAPDGMLSDDTMLILLSDVAAWVPAALVKPVLSAASIAKPEISVVRH